MGDLFQPEPSGKQARPYQTRAIELLRQSLGRGNRRVVCALPTGSGKTFIASQIVRSARDKGKRVCFTVPFISLVDQTLAAFEAEGIDHIGVIQAQHHRTDYSAPVQIASMQSMAKRGVPEADLVIVDECHLSYRLLPAWMRDDPKRTFIGLSATPWARGMGDIWDDLVRPVSMQELIDGGYLSPFRVFAPSHPDLSSVKTVAGDYHEGQLGDVMSDKVLIADVVDTWLQRARGLPTLVFAVNLAHAEKIQRAFAERGIRFGYCDAKVDLAERQYLFQQMARGEIEGIVNVATLTTGVDADVRCVVMARPTKSEMLFVQCIGRGLRTADGKADCIARDSLVLTDKGLVKIQDVTLDHKVWDGVSFVNHGGAVCKGVQPVITHDGVTGTTDHKVLTKYGWQTLAEAHRNGSRIARTGVGGQAVRLTDDSFRCGARIVLQLARSCGVRALWRAAHGAFPQYAQKAANEGLFALQRTFARGRPQMALSALPVAAGSLLQSAFNVLSALWREGDRVSLCGCERGFAMGGGKSGHRRSLNAIGQDRQRRSLRAGQYPLVASGGEFEQHTKGGRFVSRSLYWVSQKLSRSAVCRPHIASPFAHGADGCRDSRAVQCPIIQTQREVWDIYNAGPLQRFTVNGRLVHNCLILDHSDNHARMGFVTSINHDKLLTGKEKQPKLKDKEKPEQVPRECPSCGALKARGPCPVCGFKPERQSDLEFEEGELVEITAGKEKKREYTMAEKAEFHAGLLWLAHSRGRKTGWAAHKYRERFGVWPVGEAKHVKPKPPSDDVKNHVLASDIRYANRRDK